MASSPFHCFPGYVQAASRQSGTKGARKEKARAEASTGQPPALARQPESQSAQTKWYKDMAVIRTILALASLVVAIISLYLAFFRA